MRGLRHGGEAFPGVVCPLFGRLRGEGAHVGAHLLPGTGDHRQDIVELAAVQRQTVSGREQTAGEFAVSVGQFAQTGQTLLLGQLHVALALAAEDHLGHGLHQAALLLLGQRDAGFRLGLQIRELLHAHVEDLLVAQIGQLADGLHQRIRELFAAGLRAPLLDL